MFIPHVALYQCLITQKFCEEKHTRINLRKLL